MLLAHQEYLKRAVLHFFTLSLTVLLLPCFLKHILQYLLHSHGRLWISPSLLSSCIWIVQWQGTFHRHVKFRWYVHWCKGNTFCSHMAQMHLLSWSQVVYLRPSPSRCHNLTSRSLSRSESPGVKYLCWYLYSTMHSGFPCQSNTQWQ